MDDPRHCTLQSPHQAIVRPRTLEEDIVSNGYSNPVTLRPGPTARHLALRAASEIIPRKAYRTARTFWQLTKPDLFFRQFVTPGIDMGRLH